MPVEQYALMDGTDKAVLYNAASESLQSFGYLAELSYIPQSAVTKEPDDLGATCSVRAGRDVLNLFRALTDQPEFRALALTFERTQYPLLPGAHDERARTSPDRPTEFNDLLHECAWGSIDKRRVVARFWENEARNWEFSASENFRFARGTIKGHVAGGLENPIFLVPAAVMGGIWAVVAIFMARDDRRNAKLCQELSKVLRHPSDRLEDTEIPRLLVPAADRIVRFPANPSLA